MLTTHQAATRRGVSVKTIQSWIAKGWLRAHKMTRDYLIEVKALDAVKVGSVGRPKKKAVRRGT